MQYRAIKTTILIIILSSARLVIAESFPFIPHESDADLTTKLTGIANTKTSEISISLNINNNTHDTIKINPSNIHLETPEKLRSPIFSNELFDTWTIKPKSNRDLNLYFRPINSRFLYQLTQLYGDFEKQYTLNIETEDSSETLKLPLSFKDEIYSAYIEKYGMEGSLNLHLPDIDNEAFTKAQLKHLETHLREVYPESPFVRAAPDQHLINGLAFRWRMYEETGNTVVSLQLVNHNKKDIILDLDKIHLKSNGKNLKPTNDLNALPNYLAKNIVPNSHLRQYKIKAGERFSWKFEFDAPMTFPAAVLNIEGLQVSDIPIYATPIQFKMAESSNW